MSLVVPSVRVLFGHHLRQLRKEREMSQEELAEATDLHVNQIGLMERGKSAASFETLEKLCKGLNTTIRELFNFDYPESTRDLLPP